MPEFQPKVVPAGENSQPADETQSFTFPKKKANNNTMPISSIELAKAEAAERALARAKEYDKINATQKDDWYYIQGEQQFGPLTLDELKAKIADLSITPPINLAWHEGMEMWKPVHEIAIICGVSPLAATQCFKLPTPARRPGEGNPSESAPEAKPGVIAAAGNPNPVAETRSSAIQQQTANNDTICPSSIELIGVENYE